MQPRSRIAKRIDADRDPTNLPVNPLPLLRLHCLHDRGDHRTDRGSLSVDEAHDGKMRPCNRYLDSEPLHLVTTQLGPLGRPPCSFADWHPKRPLLPTDCPAFGIVRYMPAPPATTLAKHQPADESACLPAKLATSHPSPRLAG